MEEMERTSHVTDEEVKKGVCALTAWMHNSLYEAGRVIKEHKRAIIAVVASLVAVAAIVAVVYTIVKKRK